MTRKEALKTLKEMAFTAYGTRFEALDTAINSLSADVRESRTSEDCISRQAVIDKLNRLIEVEKLQGTDEMGYGRERVNAYEYMIHEVESEYLHPSAEPKKGEWKRKIVDSGFNADWVCSECGHREMTDFISYNFCPNCGADMRGE